MEKSILIVEDNDHLRIILATIVERLGYHTIVAGTGAEALAKAASGKPDLILLDLDLPDMIGTQVAYHLRHDPACGAFPIIGCSAYSARDERQRALQAGMVDYLKSQFLHSSSRSKSKSTVAKQSWRRNEDENLGSSQQRVSVEVMAKRPHFDLVILLKR